MPTYSARLRGSSTVISDLLGAFTPHVICRTLFLMLRVKMCETLPPFASCCGYQVQLERYCSIKALSQNCKKATINFVLSVRPSVCLSVLMELLVSHWTVIHEILYFRIFRNSVEKTPLHIHDNISLSSSWNEKCFIQKL